MSETHGCEICNKRAIVAFNDKWYCPEHIDAGMKLLAKPLKLALRNVQRRQP